MTDLLRVMEQRTRPWVVIKALLQSLESAEDVSDGARAVEGEGKGAVVAVGHG